MRIRGQRNRGEILRKSPAISTKANPAPTGARVAKRSAALIAAASLAVAASVAPAASNVYTWNNAGADFNTAGDWNFNGGVSTVYPGTAGGGAITDVADFNTLVNQPNVSASDSLGELEFDTAGWTLSGNAGTVLTLNGGSVDGTNGGATNIGLLSAPTSGTNTIGVGLDIGANQVWQVATGSTLNVTGTVTDTNNLTIGATGFTGAVNFSQPITYGGFLTAAGSAVTFSAGWQPNAVYGGSALQVSNNGSVTFGGTTSITTNNTNTSPGGYILDNLAGSTIAVNSGAALNLSVQADNNGGSPALNEHLYVYNGSGATITNNGTMTFTGRPALVLDANSTVNDNGAMSFNPVGGATSGFLLMQMGDGAVFNVGSPTSPGGSLTVTQPAGIVVEGTGTGANVGRINVYGSLTGNATGAGTPYLRLGTDTAGAQDVMTVYSAGAGGAPGSVTVNSLALGDNSGSTATAGILGAIYLQAGTTLDINTTGVGNGVFSIGAAGGATPGSPTSSTGGGGQFNDFGYVYVGTGASIGKTSAPGQIDIGGQLRAAGLSNNVASVAGGNGVMDVVGGTVNAGKVGLSDSNYDQQFSSLNLMAGSTLNLTANKGTGSILTLAGTSNAATAGIYGSYSVVNVIDSTVSMTGTNNAINVAGSSGGGAGNNPHQTFLLPTGILNINGASSVTAGYVRGGAVSIGGTPVAGSNPTIYDGTASGFVNFNGGALNDIGGSGTFMFQSVAGYYIYNGGATITGPGNSNSILANTGFSAPLGQGIPTGRISLPPGSGGSGYVAPPAVLISDPTGFDASGYAVVFNGEVVGVVITNPGFNMSNPTVQLIGGGGSGASVTLPPLINNASGPLTVNVNSGTTFTLTGNFAGTNGNNGSGGYPAAIYSLTNTNGSDNYNTTGTSNSLAVDMTGNAVGNNPYANGKYYGFTYHGIRNNISTYTGPTVIQSGTLALSAPASSATLGNPNDYATGTFAAANNTIPFSSAIVVGDVPANSAAVLSVTGVAGSGGFQLAPGLVNSSTYGNTTYSYTTNPQVLAGFGTVKGSSSVGLTVGLAGGSVSATSTGTASTGNNFGGYPYAATGTFTSAPAVNNSTVSPGYTNSGKVVPMGTSMFLQDNLYGPIVIGTGTSASPAFTFNTQQGNAKTQTDSSAVGSLALGGNNSMTTTFGPGGVYYWKLDLTNGGTGATGTPGLVNSASASYIGKAWDNLVIDNLAVTSTGSNAFTIQAVGFNASNTLSGGVQIPVISNAMPSNSYSWVVAQVRSNGNLANLLADMSLNTSGLPAPASGYQYFLNAQPDPSGTMSDLVVNYAPVPEPTGLALLGMGAGAMMVRRRRRVVA